MMELVFLQEETPVKLLALLFEDTARRQLSASQEEGPHQSQLC